MARLTNAKVVNGEYPEFELDFPSFRVSFGGLPGATDAGVVSVEEGVLEFSWAPANSERKAQWNDQVMMLAFIPEKARQFILQQA